MQLTKFLVSPQWLYQNRNHPDLVVLDASMAKVNPDTHGPPEGHIPKSVYFDLKNKFSDQHAPYPNTVPDALQFQKEARALGINKNSVVIVYDAHGIYSSPRAWYLLRAFGHENCAVLDGGLPEWIRMGYPTEPKRQQLPSHGNFEARYTAGYFVHFNEIQQYQKQKDHLILDARSSERFKGSVAEPRIGLRRGNIPGSKNIPFKDVLEGHVFKPREKLQDCFKATAAHDQKLVFSCGSGITACILALAAYSIGKKDIAVYDGSWTEYGSIVSK